MESAVCSYLASVVVLSVCDVNYEFDVHTFAKT